MSRDGRRTNVSVEVERRTQERAAQLGARIRAMRIARRWTQAALGRRADLGRLVVGRLERGEGVLDVERLERIALAFGVPLAVGFDRDPKQDVADAGHLAIQELVLRLARAAGLQRRFEMPTKPNEPWRSADVAVGDPRQRAAADIECWNTLGDIGAATRSSNRKVVELAQLAVAAWGPDARTSLCWVIRDTARNREIVAKYPELFEDKFPGSSVAWVRALTGAGPIPKEAGLVWCDVRTTRIFAWRRPRG